MRVRVWPPAFIPQPAIAPRTGEIRARVKKCQKLFLARKQHCNSRRVHCASARRHRMSSLHAHRPLRIRPVLVVALVASAALTLGVSVLLALSPGMLPLSDRGAHALQIANVALSGVALAFALFAARPLFRRRLRKFDGLITVCAWTRRVKWQGRWMTMEEYLTQCFNLRCTHGICDEAAEKMRADLAQIELNPDPRPR
jgi:hypothetical protein